MIGSAEMFTFFFVMLGPLKVLGPFAQRTRGIDAATKPLPPSPIAAAGRLVFPFVLTPYGIAAVIALLASSGGAARMTTMLLLLFVVMILPHDQTRRVRGGRMMSTSTLGATMDDRR